MTGPALIMALLSPDGVAVLSRTLAVGAGDPDSPFFAGCEFCLEL